MEDLKITEMINNFKIVMFSCIHFEWFELTHVHIREELENGNHKMKIFNGESAF